MGDSLRRKALNEALFRAVNESIAQIDASFRAPAEALEIVCECDDIACIERIAIPRAAYHDVREIPTRFLIVPGHADATVESVTERHDGYWVVQKRDGEPAELARATE